MNCKSQKLESNIPITTLTLTAKPAVKFSATLTSQDIRKTTRRNKTPVKLAATTVTAEEIRGPPRQKLPWRHYHTLTSTLASELWPVEPKDSEGSPSAASMVASIVLPHWPVRSFFLSLFPFLFQFLIYVYISNWLRYIIVEITV